MPPATSVVPKVNEFIVGTACVFCLSRSVLSKTLCDPVDYTVHGILQVRILEWVAFPFSRGSSQPRDQTQVSRIADSLPAEPQGKHSSLNCSAKTAEKAQYPPIPSLLSYQMSTVYKAQGLSKGHGGRHCCTLKSCVQLEEDLSSGACLSFNPLRIYLVLEGDCISD